MVPVLIRACPCPGQVLKMLDFSSKSEEKRFVCKKASVLVALACSLITYLLSKCNGSVNIGELSQHLPKNDGSLLTHKGGLPLFVGFLPIVTFVLYI